ncbi:MAG: 4-hydroxy-3-methylbut-2-enyl diphosphate reductase [Solirubrobacteraceae bacterium]
MTVLVKRRGAGATSGAEAEPGAPGTHQQPVLVASLRMEAHALRGAARWAEVMRCGMGEDRARAFAERGVLDGGRPLVIAGFCGALDPDLLPGDLVLATELRADGRRVVCDDATILAGHLRRGGLRVHVGPIHTSDTLVRGSAERERLHASGAIAVDMESVWLVPQRRSAPVVVLRAVVDTASRELHRPLRTTAGAAAAYRSLARAAQLMEEWAASLGARQLVMASPRASCAGVQRAVEIVERVLQQRGGPVYVRRQIVHNAHVVESLARRGAVFVKELDEVPEGATVIFSAHGVSPQVRAQAQSRSLEVIDATCPLVAKVHAEARRFAQAGYSIVLIGHEDHEEVVGTVGEAPERIQVIADAEAVATLAVDDDQRVAHLSQTTLAVDETDAVIEALRARFPAVASPPSADICFATQNRQDAVRAVAADADLVVVVGSANSSNSCRLVEVAQRAGGRAILVEDAEQLRPADLRGVRRIGLSAGASVPEVWVQAVVTAISGLGELRVGERSVATESVHFKLPPELGTGEQ